MQMLGNKNTRANETHSIKDFIYSAWEQIQKCLTNKQIFVISVWQKSFDLGVFWIINGASLHMHLLKGSGFPSQGLRDCCCVSSTGWTRTTFSFCHTAHCHAQPVRQTTSNQNWLISSIDSAVFYLQDTYMIFSGNSRAGFQRMATLIELLTKKSGKWVYANNL